MATDYGTDVLTVDGHLDPLLRVHSGIAVLVAALVRRLITVPGELFYDTGYGFPLPRMLSAAVTRRQLLKIRVGIARELEKDDRVQKARVSSFEYDTATRALSFTVEITTLSGTFDLVLAANAVTVDVLGVQRAAA